MSNRARYILGVQLSEPEKFYEIFGAVMAQLAQEDISRWIRQLCASLLQCYDRHGEVISPRFGLWCLLFGAKASLLSIDMEEQMAVLQRAGIAKLRELFIGNFGQATGSRQDFSLAIAEVPEDGEIIGIEAAIERALKTALRANGCHGNASRETIREIIEKDGLETYFQPIVAPAEEIFGRW